MALIPARRLVDWTEGTTNGVGVLGGIAQYQPGGANQRTTLRNVVTSDGADNTGATNASTAINAALSSIGTNGVVYLPTGVYKVTSTIGPGIKSNYTLRGDGQFTLSRSVNTMGTGSKTFEVAPDLGYVAGCGVWVWVWDRTQVGIKSIIRSGTTATVTTKGPDGDEFPHGYATGQIVEHRGCGEPEYNIPTLITVTGPTTYTYQVAGSPASPASGVWKYSTLNTKISATLTHAAGVVTVTTAVPAGLGANNEMVSIVGADQAQYNLQTTGSAGLIPPTYVNSTTFTFALPGSGTPTGSIFVGSAGNEGQGFGTAKVMKGTCTSYSGTTLVLKCMACGRSAKPCSTCMATPP